MGKKSVAECRLSNLRERMREENIDAWLVLSSDYHESEYVGDFFKCREYLSGFTGSAGTMVVLQKEAGLWTDGRYFLQAEEQLEGSGITLFRKGEENEISLEEFLIQKMPEGACLGVDGRTISVSGYRKLKKKLDQKNIQIRLDCDLVGDIWADRPSISHNAAWELEICHTGKTRAEKLTMLRKKLDEEAADSSVISSLDDIAWTLNIRGSDVAYTPVVLGFLYIEKTHAIWFVHQEAVNESLAQRLGADGVIIRDYNETEHFLAKESQGHNVYLDPDKTNMMIYQEVQKRKKACQGKIVEGKNVTLLPKAIKNRTEIENMQEAHRKDAVACIKFIYWLKTAVGKMHAEKQGNNKDDGREYQHAKLLTELSVAEKLEEYRKEQKHYLGPSFRTIAGYAHHGAIIHYGATRDSNLSLKPQDFILIDSGGHYLEGTTDITRTIALGPLTQEQKHHYTLVLKGNINLAAAKFRYGSAGISLDSFARKALWEEGLDYNHGTGHGVGYLLSVHEPPNSFRNAVGDHGYECMRMEPGMITSNEPGIYLPGKYGIRLENLIVCKELEKNTYGRFLGFETLTLVPFERDAIVAEELEAWERKWLNLYHARIFQEVGKYLNSEEYAWLREITKEI